MGYNVGVVLRLNGRLEIYSDFNLSNEYQNPEKQAVDIETDFNQFYFKIAQDSHKVTEETDLSEINFMLRQVRHLWRNRIGISTSKHKNRFSKWDQVIHLRISSYVNLYS